MDPYTLGATMDDEDEIGALINTPGSILSEMQRVKGLVETLDVDIKSNSAKLRPVFTDAWNKFRGEWETFWRDHSEGFGGWTSRLWGATAEQTTSFVDRVSDWRRAFEKESGTSATGAVSEGGIPWKWVLYAGLAIGGIVAIGYAAKGIRGVAEAI